MGTLAGVCVVVLFISVTECRHLGSQRTQFPATTQSANFSHRGSSIRRRVNNRPMFSGQPNTRTIPPITQALFIIRNNRPQPTRSDVPSQNQIPNSPTSNLQQSNRAVSTLKSANQVVPSPRRVRMNTQNVQRQRSINSGLRQNNVRIVQQNPQRGGHMASPRISANRNQGRHTQQRNGNNVQIMRSQIGGGRIQVINPIRTNHQSNMNGIRTNQGPIVRSNSQPLSMLKSGIRPINHGQNQNGRRIQNNPVNTFSSTRQSNVIGQVVRNGRRFNNGNSLNQGQGRFNTRGELKQGVSSQILIRAQTDTSKANNQVTRGNERGMWKNIPSLSQSNVDSLAQLKNGNPIQLRPMSQMQGPIAPLVNLQAGSIDLASTKNQIPVNLVGNAASGITANDVISNVAKSPLVQGAGNMISLELKLKSPNGKTETVQLLKPASNTITSSVLQAGNGTPKTIGPISSSGTPSGSLETLAASATTQSSSLSNSSSVNGVDINGLQLQGINSSTTADGKKKMSLTLMSSQTGGRPIVIEALGKIVLSQQSLPDGRVQFVIKADPPSSSKSKSTTSKSPSVTSSSASTAPATTTALTTTTLLPGEELEFEPGEFTTPSGMGTTEPM